MSAQFVETYLDSPTGAKLKLYSRMPEGRVRAAVQINHGMAEHAARYARFAEALADAGFAAYAHDHRGHGQTTAPDASPGVFGGKGLDNVVADLMAVNRHIRARAEIPVIVFGHSMGSVIALNFALRHSDRLAALACWNAGVETGILARVARVIMVNERMLRGRDRPSRIAPALTFTSWNRDFRPNRTDFDWLSRDEAEVDKYVADPLCGFDVSTGLWQDVLSGIFFAADQRKFGRLGGEMPVHLVGGGVDPCTNGGNDMRHLARRFERAGMQDVTLKVLPETRHESLNEINRDETTAQFIEWLSARFP